MVLTQIERRGVSSAEVLRAMRTIPRHEFIPKALRDQAGDDQPLPIGCGQTISQPYIVALMTELLELKHGQKVLEIGTGSGYQAAILAAILPDVFTIEIVGELHERAREVLKRVVNLEADHVRHGDGYFGWEEKAPFDAIIVTAAAEDVPPPLVRQLKPGGRMIIPIGPSRLAQDLVIVEKDAQGRISRRAVLPVRFVPLTGGPAAAPS